MILEIKDDPCLESNGSGHRYQAVIEMFDDDNVILYRIGGLKIEDVKSQVRIEVNNAKLSGFEVAVTYQKVDYEFIEEA